MIRYDQMANTYSRRNKYIECFHRKATGIEKCSQWFVKIGMSAIGISNSFGWHSFISSFENFFVTLSEKSRWKKKKEKEKEAKNRRNGKREEKRRKQRRSLNSIF